MPDQTNHSAPEERFKEAFIAFAEKFIPGGDIKRAAERVQRSSNYEQGFLASGSLSIANLRAALGGHAEEGITHELQGDYHVFTIPLKGTHQPELARFYAYSLTDISELAQLGVVAERKGKNIFNAEGEFKQLGRNVKVKISSASLEPFIDELKRVTDHLNRYNNTLTGYMGQLLKIATAFDKVEGTKLYPKIHFEKSSDEAAPYSYRFDLVCEGIPEKLCHEPKIIGYANQDTVVTPSPDTLSRDLRTPYLGAGRSAFTMEDVVQGVHPVNIRETIDDYLLGLKKPPRRPFH